MARRTPRQTLLLHVQAQIVDALDVAREIGTPTHVYSKPVKRALALAFAVHFRVLMEFLHESRPPGKKVIEDIRLSDLVGPAWVKPPWSSYRSRRVIAADKLAAHLSSGRRRRHHTQYSWGCGLDVRALVGLLRMTFRKYPTLVADMPQASAAIKSAG